MTTHSLIFAVIVAVGLPVLGLLIAVYDERKKARR